jgi:hypothetical protein
MKEQSSAHWIISSTECSTILVFKPSPSRFLFHKTKKEFAPSLSHDPSSVEFRCLQSWTLSLFLPLLEVEEVTLFLSLLEVEEARSHTFRSLELFRRGFLGGSYYKS